MKISSDALDLFEQIRLCVATAKASVSAGEVLSVSLTSRLPGEGVTTVALGLARTFGRTLDGKVLLIDAVTSKSGETSPRGIAGTQFIPNADVERPNELATHIVPVDGAGFDVLRVCRDTLAAPAYEKYVPTLLTNLGGQYEVIVVDTGALDWHGSFAWSRCVRQSLLVVDTTRTTIWALKRMRKELDERHLTVSGVVLNKRAYPIPRFLYRSAR